MESVGRIEDGNVKIKTRGSNWKYVAIIFILISVALGAYTIYEQANHTKSQEVVKCTTPTTTTESTKPSDENKICLTSTCIIAASQIMQSMNTSVDPCENFYDYACGNWGEHNRVPEGRTSYGVFTAIRYDVQRKLHNLLTESVKINEPKSVTKTKHTYQSCMDLETINKLGSDPLEDSLVEYGGWPIALGNVWDEKKFDAYKALSSQLTNGIHSLINWGSIYTDKTYTKRGFAIGYMKPCMPNYLYENNYYLKVYKNLIVNVSIILGADENEAEIQAKQMVDLELRLIKDLLTNVNYTYEVTLKYNQLSELSDTFEFNTFIKNSFENIDLTFDENMNVTSFIGKEYFNNLTRIIQDTDKKVLANYIIWHNVYNSITHCSPKLFGDAIKEYITGLFGSYRSQDRTHYCSRATNNAFQWPIGRMFVEKYFDESAKDTATEMVGELKSAFKEMLDKVDWMDQKAIDVAKEKADAIDERIGYPNFIMNNDKLDEMFEGVTTSEYTFFENWRSVEQFHVKRKLGSLGVQKESVTWSISPSTVNAFYSPPHNRITFPAGILQIPFYHKSYPKYLNFAGIGFVIGHEITHGFDNNGRKFDKDGNKHIWWSDEVTKKYEKRIKCYINQYDNFTIDSKHVNGKRTLNENLADNGAVKESFLAYRNYVEDELKGVEEPMLPGFEDKNQNQLFFLNVAQAWCNKVVDKKYWNRALKGVHSPGRFRILGSMANSDDFAKTYKCKIGTKMNPVKKCKLW